MSTAGNLVFQGRGSGELWVYAADTGKVLKTIQTGSHIMAAPITYAVNGVQYVAVQVGYGGTNIAGYPIPPSSAASKYQNVNRMITFKLDGGEVRTPPVLVDTPFPKPPEKHATAAQLDLGEVKFNEQCSRCHVLGLNVTPDLQAAARAARRLQEYRPCRHLGVGRHGRLLRHTERGRCRRDPCRSDRPNLAGLPEEETLGKK